MRLFTCMVITLFLASCSNDDIGQDIVGTEASHELEMWQELGSSGATGLRIASLSLEEDGEYLYNAVTGDSAYAKATGTTVVSGPRGNARHFNNGDVITWSDEVLNNTTLTGLVINFWMKVDTIAHAVLFFKGEPYVWPYDKDWAVVLEPDATLRFQVSNFDVNDIRTTAFVETGVWYHISCRWRSGDSRIYVDRVLMASGSVTTDISTLDFDSHAGFIDDGYFEGSLDEIRIKVELP